MNENIYLTKQQVTEKYPFLTSNVLKNLLFRNLNQFRSKVIHRLGKRILINEQALLKFLSEAREGGENYSSTIANSLGRDHSEVY